MSRAEDEIKIFKSELKFLEEDNDREISPAELCIPNDMLDDWYLVLQIMTGAHPLTYTLTKMTVRKQFKRLKACNSFKEYIKPVFEPARSGHYTEDAYAIASQSIAEEADFVIALFEGKYDIATDQLIKFLQYDPRPMYPSQYNGKLPVNESGEWWYISPMLKGTRLVAEFNPYVDEWQFCNVEKPSHRYAVYMGGFDKRYMYDGYIIPVTQWQKILTLASRCAGINKPMPLFNITPYDDADLVSSNDRGRLIYIVTDIIDNTGMPYSERLKLLADMEENIKDNDEARINCIFKKIYVATRKDKVEDEIETLYDELSASKFPGLVITHSSCRYIANSTTSLSMIYNTQSTMLMKIESVVVSDPNNPMILAMGKATDDLEVFAKIKRGIPSDIIENYNNGYKYIGKTILVAYFGFNNGRLEGSRLAIMKRPRIISYVEKEII